MRHDDSLLNRQLDEYILVRQLGRGGMARIYLGLDRRLRRYAAIKVIDKPLRAEEQYLRRFEQEAQTIAQLEHPRIVRLYRYGEVGGLLYMAMQYIAGSDLSALLSSYRQDGQHIAAAEAARIVREIGEALDYAHARGVIHRDVTPSNIMLDEQGRVYLADFGLALYTELDDSLDVFGTPQYMAPEQVVSSANVVPQSDLYALGVITYQMFTGEKPFEDEDPMEVARRQRMEAPRPPRVIRPAISPEVEAVILKAMAKDPAGRYASGAAFADALDRALAAQAAQPLHPTEPALTVPERVTMVRRPGPPQPKAVVNPATQVVEVDEPATGRRAPRWRYLVASGLLLLILCLGLPLALLSGLREDGPPPVAGPAATPTLAEVPTRSATASPTPSPTVTPRPTAVPIASNFSLELVGTDDVLFLINRSPESVLLSRLRLEGKRGSLDGEEWGVATLRPQACVTVRQEDKDPTDPDVTCVQVGHRLTRSKSERFWRDRFDVIYEGETVGDCQGRTFICEITVGE